MPCGCRAWKLPTAAPPDDFAAISTTSPRSSTGAAAALCRVRASLAHIAEAVAGGVWGREVERKTCACDPMRSCLCWEENNPIAATRVCFLLYSKIGTVKAYEA